MAEVVKETSLIAATFLAILVPLDQFKFEGGTGTTLARLSAEKTGKLVTLAENTGDFAKFEFTYAGYRQIGASLARTLGRRSVETNGAISLPVNQLPRFFVNSEGEVYQIEFLNQALLRAPETGIRLADGEVIIDGKGATIRCGVLKSLQTKQRIEFHWLLESMVVSTSGPQMPVRKFLQAVAEALPATLATTEEAAKFELDVPEFRRLWIARFEMRKAQTSRNVVDQAMDYAAVSALEALSTESLRDLMKKPRQFAHMTVSDDIESPVTRSFRRYIELYRTCADLPKLTFENFQFVDSQVKAREEQLKVVDWSKPWRITFYNLGRIDFLLPTDKPNAWVAFSVE